MNRVLSILYPATLLLVFSLLFFTALHKPEVIDYDEGVYAEVSRGMFKQQELIIPELNGEGFFEKPPMLYWAQMLGYKFFGVNPMGARFFNGVAALVTLLVFYFGSAPPLGKRTAFQATLLILATRAGRLLHVTSLGGWLHRVAYNTALRAAQRRAKLLRCHQAG